MFLDGGTNSFILMTEKVKKEKYHVRMIKYTFKFCEKNQIYHEGCEKRLSPTISSD